MSLDFAKTSDSIPISILEAKLESRRVNTCGVEGKVLYSIKKLIIGHYTKERL